MLFHEVGQDAGVGGEAGEGDAVVGVDGYYLLLVRGEFFCVALLEWGEGGVVVSWLSYDGAKLAGWKGSDDTLIAARTAWVLLTMPTTTEPCLTASCAYSTWKIRPWGELGGMG